MLDLLDLQKSFSEKGILISFNGAFTHSIIEEIGNAVKKYLEGVNLSKGAITDVFAVYIEQTQNVRNYTVQNKLSESGHETAIVVISRFEDLYTVSSGNSILKKDVNELTIRLEQIKSLDKNGLKSLYRQQLRKPSDPDNSKAGLGLIDIARRSVGEIEYSFQPLDSSHDFFSLKVNVRGAE